MIDVTYYFLPRSFLIFGLFPKHKYRLHKVLKNYLQAMNLQKLGTKKVEAKSTFFRENDLT